MGRLNVSELNYGDAMQLYSLSCLQAEKLSDPVARQKKRNPIHFHLCHLPHTRDDMGAVSKTDPATACTENWAQHQNEWLREQHNHVSVTFPHLY